MRRARPRPRACLLSFRYGTCGVWRALRIVLIRYAHMPGKAYTALALQPVAYGYLTPENCLECACRSRSAAVDGRSQHVADIRAMACNRITPRRTWPSTLTWTAELHGRRGCAQSRDRLGLMACGDINPNAIHLTVPRGFRTRKAVPATYRLHRLDLNPGEIGWYEGIPIVTPERAIMGGIEQALGWTCHRPGDSERTCARTHHTAGRGATRSPAPYSAWQSA